jgi:hypothetical protein
MERPCVFCAGRTLISKYHFHISVFHYFLASLPEVNMHAEATVTGHLDTSFIGFPSS